MTAIRTGGLSGNEVVYLGEAADADLIEVAKIQNGRAVGQELRDLNSTIIDYWEVSVRRVAELEKRIQVVHLMMAGIAEADMPEEIPESAFRMFAKCRLKQFCQIMGDALLETNPPRKELVPIHPTRT